MTLKAKLLSVVTGAIVATALILTMISRMDLKSMEVDMKQHTQNSTIADIKDETKSYVNLAYKTAEGVIERTPTAGEFAKMKAGALSHMLNSFYNDNKNKMSEDE